MRSNYAWLACRQGRWADAVRLFAAAFDESPPDAASFLRLLNLAARAAARAGMEERALMWLRAQLEILRENPPHVAQVSFVSRLADWLSAEVFAGLRERGGEFWEEVRGELRKARGED
jgi:hypothetical protein